MTTKKKKKKNTKKIYAVRKICEGDFDDVDIVEANTLEDAFEVYKKDFGLEYDTHENTSFVVCELKPVLKFSQSIGWRKENV